MLVRPPVLVVPAEVAAEEREVRVDLVVGLVPALAPRQLGPAGDLGRASPRSPAGGRRAGAGCRRRRDSARRSRGSERRRRPRRAGRGRRGSGGSRRQRRSPWLQHRPHAYRLQALGLRCPVCRSRGRLSRRSRRPTRLRPRDLGAAPLAPRAPARRRADAATGGTTRRRPSSAAAGSSPASPRASALALAVGGVDAVEELPGSSAAAALLFVAGLVDDVFSLRPLVEDRGAVRRGRARARDAASRWRSSATTSLAVALGVALARRDDERVQPARQHGRPRGDPRRDRLHVLRDRRGHRARGPARARARARRSALACLGFLPVQPPPGPAGGGVHGRLGQPGARLHARRARPRDELEGRGVDGRDAACCRSLVLARADPRHGARHGRCASSRAGRSTRAAATTPRTGSSTAASPSSARSSCSPLIAAGPRRDEPRLQRPRRLAGDARRRARHLRAARPVRRLPRRPERGAPRTSRCPAAGLLRTLVLHRRRLIEVLVDFALITASFFAAYLLRRRAGTGTAYAAARLQRRAAGDPGRALPRVHPARASTGASGDTPARARRRAIVIAVVRLGARRVRVRRRRRRPFGDFPLAIFVDRRADLHGRWSAPRASGSAALARARRGR